MIGLALAILAILILGPPILLGLAVAVEHACAWVKGPPTEPLPAPSPIERPLATVALAVTLAVGTLAGLL